MKNKWMFLLLTPLMPLSAAYPIYDEEYDASYDLEMNTHQEVIASESYVDDWEQEVAGEVNEDSLAYENEAQEEEVIATPQMRSRNKAKAPAYKRQSTQSAKRHNSRSSGQSSPSARSRVKDVRQNSDRPRVTHRGQEPGNYRNQGQIEADSQMEEPAYEPAEEPRYKSSKIQKAPAKVKKKTGAAEKKTGQVQRPSSKREQQKGIKAKSYRHSLKKLEKRSSHPGKRPVSE